MVLNNERIVLAGSSYEISLKNTEEGFYFDVHQELPRPVKGIVRVHFEDVRDLSVRMGVREPIPDLLRELNKRKIGSNQKIGYISMFYPYGSQPDEKDQKKGLGKIMLKRVEEVAALNDLTMTYLITARSEMVRCAIKSAYELINSSTLFKILR